jgi:hypothetical protein
MGGTATRLTGYRLANETSYFIIKSNAAECYCGVFAPLRSCPYTWTWTGRW